jgi:Mrp family chromosome partitioning ATPase
MGRMLQALKNLEARSAWPVAGKNLLDHLAADRSETLQTVRAESAPAVTQASAPAVTQAFAPAVTQAFAPAVTQAFAPAVTQAFAPLATPAVPGAGLREPPQAEPILPPTPAPVDPSTLRAPAQESAAPAARQVTRQAAPQPRSIERSIERMLGEPHRRRIIQELAGRLRQDAQETGSRSLLFVGIGEESAAHDGLLQVAALMAEEGGRVLLVDGDLARQALTLDLESSALPGLTNALSASQPAAELVQPTSTEGFDFLPAGSARHLALAANDDRLARVLGELAGDYDLLLIDGGRTGEANTAALARAADATYIVVRLGTVEASTAQAALRELRASGARVLGCVANS